MSQFNVLFLGAGIVNFGGKAGPWNHSLRLEQKLGERLRVVGIVDPFVEQAEKVLTAKRNAGIAGYAETQLFTCLSGTQTALTGERLPTLAVLGFHCAGRGSTKEGRDAEIQLIQMFPDIALFMEKPISMDTFEEVTAVAEALKAKGTITSVGYMLRYVKVVQKMKELIKENNLRVMATQARYLMAYEFAGTTWERIGFWDKAKQLGPIVEQATHVCDLSRYFAPEPILESVQVQTIEHTDTAGKLSKLTIDEEGRVPPENRISRMTTAMWRYADGACGTLLHGTVLHEGEFSVELAVMADGWLMRLVDPYNVSPRLFVRRPGSGKEEEIQLGEDDCYTTEISTIVDVIEGRLDRSAILSSFEDAVQSYKLTWAIRWKGEEEYKARVQAT